MLFQYDRNVTLYDVVLLQECFDIRFCTICFYNVFVVLIFIMSYYFVYALSFLKSTL